MMLEASSNRFIRKGKTMPRGARLDAPGTLHHVIIRGIEKGNICSQAFSTYCC